MVEQIEQLNKKIESLMIRKNRSDAQKELWQANLKDATVEYEKEYGVNIKGNDLAELKENLEKEIISVSRQVKADFNKAEKIINCIESGDIDGAWEAIGKKRPDAHISEINTEVEYSEDEEAIEEETESNEVEESSSAEFLQQVENLRTNEVKGKEGYGEALISELQKSVDEDEEVITVEDTKELHIVGGEEVSDKSFSFMAGGKKVDVVGAEEAVAEVEKPTKGKVFVMEDDEDDFIVPTSTTKTESAKKALVVDDDEAEDDFGGFKNILNGSKFGF